MYRKIREAILVPNTSTSLQTVLASETNLAEEKILLEE
jgi:hypothetical protein